MPRQREKRKNEELAPFYAIRSFIFEMISEIKIEPEKGCTKVREDRRGNA